MKNKLYLEAYAICGAFPYKRVWVLKAFMSPYIP